MTPERGTGREARGNTDTMGAARSRRSGRVQATGGRNGGAAIMTARREHPGGTDSRSADGAHEAATTGGSTTAAQALMQPQV